MSTHASKAFSAARVLTQTTINDARSAVDRAAQLTQERIQRLDKALEIRRLDGSLVNLSNCKK